MEELQTTVNSKTSYWQTHITRWQQSGFSQAQYCRIHELALSTFTYWKRKLARPDDPTPQFYPLMIQDHPPIGVGSSYSGLRLVIGSSRFEVKIAREFASETLVELIQTLEKL